LLYATDMTLAYQTHEKGWSDEVQTILDRHRPKAGEPDRRGFEWHLLQSMVKPPSCVTLVGHKGPANELAMFPNRAQIASVGNDGTLRIWNVRDRELWQTIKICDAELHSVAISPDGGYVAVGSYGDGRGITSVVYLCDIKQDGRITPIFDGKHTVESLAFSGNGKQLAVGTRYDEVCLITLDGRVINRIPCTSRNQTLACVPGHGWWLLANRRDTSVQEPFSIVQLWREDLSGLARELNDGMSFDVARMSPCGKFVAAGQERKSRMHLLEVETGDRITDAPVSRDWLIDLAFSPDGKAIAIGYRNGHVHIVGIRTGQNGNPMFEERPRVFSAHQGEVRSVRFFDAATLATCGADGLVRIWGMNHDAANAVSAADIGMNSLALSPDGRLLLTVGGIRFRIIDTQSGDLIFRSGNSDRTYHGAAWSPAGDMIAVGSRANDAIESVVILGTSGHSVCHIPHAGAINEFAFSPTGSRIAIIGDEAWQIASSIDGKAVYRRSLPARGTAIAFSHNGSRIAYGGDIGRIVVFDADKLQPLYEIPCTSAASCLAFSPDDAILASGHGDSVIRIWDVETSRLRGELAGHEQHVGWVAFSADGRTLLSRDEDIGRLWSLDHNRGYGVFHRRAPGGRDPGAKYAVTLSADGRSLAVGFETAKDVVPDVTLWRVDPALRE
jgi:WD40 repeat protein